MKRTTACWAAAGLIISLLTLFVLRYGTTHSGAVLVDSDPLIQAADQIMTCAAAGDYEALESLLYGAPQLGAAPEKDDSAQGQIWKAYLESMEYSFPGNCYPVDSNIALDVHVKCLDISSVTDALQEIAPDLMTKKAASITDGSKVYDSEHNFREAFLAEVMAESAAQVLKSGTQTMERTFSLQFTRSQGVWQALPTQELFQLLSGFVSG